MNRNEEYSEACLENRIFDVWLARQEFLVNTPSACHRVRSFKRVSSALLITSVLSWVFFFSFAFPPLESYDNNGYVFNVPVGWQVDIDEQQGLINLKEDTNDPFSADIFALTIFNQQGLSAYQANEQMVLSMELSDVYLLDQQDVENGSLVVISATLQGTPIKVALLSFVDIINNSLSMAVFSATTERFDILGGAQLLFVTIGGEDPALYENSTIANSNNQTGAGTNIASNIIDYDQMCFQQDSVTFGADYCVYQRAISVRTPVSTDLLLGEWSYALSVPTGQVWEDSLTNGLSFDASGTGMAMFFHADGRYDIIYHWSSSYNFCTNSVKAAESGRYSFNGSSLILQDARSKAELSTCGGTPNIMENAIVPSQLEIAFVDANQLSLELSCDNHSYMIACNNKNTRYFVLERSSN